MKVYQINEHLFFSWLMERDGGDFDFSLSKSLVRSELDAWQAFHKTSTDEYVQIHLEQIHFYINNNIPFDVFRSVFGYSVSVRNLSLTSELQDVLKLMMARLGTDAGPIEPGSDIVAGSTLPCHSDVHYSSLTQKCIQVCNQICDSICKGTFLLKF